jgi:hypothetical protein
MLKYSAAPIRGSPSKWETAMEDSGILYVLTNPFMPGLVKIRMYHGAGGGAH